MHDCQCIWIVHLCHRSTCKSDSFVYCSHLSLIIFICTCCFVFLYSSCQYYKGKICFIVYVLNLTLLHSAADWTLSLPGESHSRVSFNLLCLRRWQGAAQPIIVCLSSGSGAALMLCDSKQEKKWANKEMLDKKLLCCDDSAFFNGEVGQEWRLWAKVLRSNYDEKCLQGGTPQATDLFTSLVSIQFCQMKTWARHWIITTSRLRLTLRFEVFCRRGQAKIL